MEEIIKDLEHTIKYFQDAKNDFQRGRVFQSIKILEALRRHDVVGRSEQFTFEDMKKAFDAGAWEHHLHTFDSWIKTQK